MGKKLTSDMQATPVVNVTEKEGSFLEGVLVERKLVKTQYGDRPVYSLKLEDSDMRFMIKEGKEYVEKKEVAQGELVSVFAPTLLDRALLKAEGGASVRIVYTGMGKSTKKGRNAPHTFEVEQI